MSRPAPDLTGQTFGRLVVVERAGTTAYRQVAYRCRCHCGKLCIAAGSHLRDGCTTSCGCFRLERIRAVQGRRRIVPDRPTDPVVAVWRSMIFRCHNPKSPAFHNYGGRGIKVCDRWRESVHAFLADMGPRPTPKHTIDRADNDGDYCPANCRWVTQKEQASNRRGLVRLTVHGRTMLLGAWAKETGVPWKTIHKRLKDGWTHEQAALTPLLGGPNSRLPTQPKRKPSRSRWAAWRAAVLLRDDYTCRACGVRIPDPGQRATLHANHVKPWHAHPELRYDVTNGQTLCKGCHRKTPTYARIPNRRVSTL